MASISQSINPNKHLKEQFVSNLNGSSMVEIAALLTITPILVFLRHFISSSKVTDTSWKKNDGDVIPSKSLRAHMVTISVDFIFIILPMLLFFTVLADWTYIGTIFLTFLVIFSVAAKR
ncbi:uncharacterized protein At4g17910-like [Carica papaya]|uniref:uncharacterized protein At4g17910-like n=1 Tax=Carica papaya TaxID=3649 RepID=UPI000B8D0FD1|nr:uncharacterized protein At4g17910-like [Carica papaya]